jgi:hypothetical protein
MFPSIGTVAPITTCPHCSVLVNGTCEVCPEGSTHPSCKDCTGGQYKPPFYRSDLFIGVVTAVLVATVSGVVLGYTNKRLGLRRGG